MLFSAHVTRRNRNDKCIITTLHLSCHLSQYNYRAKSSSSAKKTLHRFVFHLIYQHITTPIILKRHSTREPFTFSPAHQLVTTSCYVTLFSTCLLKEKYIHTHIYIPIIAVALLYNTTNESLSSKYIVKNDRCNRSSFSFRSCFKFYFEHI